MKLFLCFLFAFIFSLFFIHSPILFGLILCILVGYVFFLLKYGVNQGNIIIIILLCTLISSDPFFLQQAGVYDIYGNPDSTPVTFYDIWIIGVVLYFLILNAIQKKPLLIGPLKPLFVFVFFGLLAGMYETMVTNNSKIGLNAFKSYIEGLLLYLMMINYDLRNVPWRKILYGLTILVTINSSIYLIKYLHGGGIVFGIVGRIAIGYEDILQVIMLTCLLLATVLLGEKRYLDQKESFLALLALIINSSLVFFSLRREDIVAYLIGIVFIWSLAKVRKKVAALFTVVIVVCVSSLFLYVTGHSETLNRMALRIESINVIKYHDDRGQQLTSSMGHISEIENGWLNVKEHIILGMGFSQLITKRYGWKGELGMVHNELLYYWIRMGIFGALVYFAMYLIPLRFCYERWKKSDTDWQWLYIGLIAFVLGRFVIEGTIAPPISLTPTKCIIYFLVMGVAMNPFMLEKKKNVTLDLG